MFSSTCWDFPISQIVPLSSLVLRPHIKWDLCGEQIQAKSLYLYLSKLMELAAQ